MDVGLIGGDPIGAQQTGGDGHDVVLHPAQAREHHGVQGVLGRVGGSRPLQQGVDLVTG